MSENVGSIEYYIDANTSGLLIAERQVNRSTRKMEGDFDRTEKSASRLERGLGRLSTVAVTLAATLAARQIVAYADAFTNVQNRLKVVTESSEELAEVTAKVTAIARESRSNLESTAVLYSRTARATEELGISQERLLGITSTITKSFTLSGATAQEASNAIRQLSQGLAAGALRGEEFNSVAEQAPEILRAVARETGKSVGELREFAAEGGITSELLISAIENYADEVNRAFADTSATFSQNAENARTAAIEYVGASELIKDTVDLAGESIAALAENLDKIEKVIIAGAAVLAGRFVGSVGSATAALIAKRAATIASERATIQATQAELALLKSQQASLAAQLASAQSTRTQSVLRRQLAVNTAALKVTNDALTASQARYNAVAGVGIALTRGLRGAMALLGGPAGVIFLAATALIYFERSMRDADEETENAARSVNQLAEEYKNLSEQQRAEQVRQASIELDALERRREELEIAREIAKEKENEAQNSSGYLGVDVGAQTRAIQEQSELNEQIADYQAAIEELETRIGILTGRIEVNTESQEDSNDALNDGSDAANNAVKSISNLALENERLRGEIDGVTEAVEIRQAIQAAGVEADSAEGRAIAELIRQNNALKDAINDRAEAERDAEGLASEFSNLSGSLAQETNSPEESLIAEREARLAIIDQYAALEIAKEDEVAAARLAVQQSYQDKLAQMETQRTQLILGSTEQIFDDLSGLAKNFAGEQSGIYKTLFAASKAFSIAQSIIAIQTGIAQAAALPFPANLGAMATVASQTAGIVSTIQGAQMGGGRLYGGNVNPGTLYPVTENGRPEILTQGNKQYLLPGSRGEVTSNRDMMASNDNSSISVTMPISVYGNTNAQDIRNALFDQEDLIYDIVERAKAKRGIRS